MTDAFADLVLPIFRNVIDLQDRLAWGESPSLDEVKKQTREWIEGAERRAVVDPELSRDLELAKFGIVAWIDEVLTESNWGRSHDWGSEDHVLEWDLYGSHIRASKFYDMAERAERETSADPLEVYLLCVALGFRGLLAYNEENLREWTERVYAQVNSARPVASRPFAEDDELPRVGLAPLRGPALLIVVSILAAATVSLTVIGYLVAVHVALPPYVG
jgi:type VI secretion system protein ImpK